MNSHLEQMKRVIVLCFHKSPHQDQTTVAQGDNNPRKPFVMVEAKIQHKQNDNTQNSNL
jgi:hypothetical protein